MGGVSVSFKSEYYMGGVSVSFKSEYYMGGVSVSFKSEYYMGGVSVSFKSEYYMGAVSVSFKAEYYMGGVSVSFKAEYYVPNFGDITRAYHGYEDAFVRETSSFETQVWGHYQKFFKTELYYDIAYTPFQASKTFRIFHLWRYLHDCKLHGQPMIT